MTRHLTDHRTPSHGGRVKRFVAIDKAQGDGLWHKLSRRAEPATGNGNRRLVEFLRILRGRSV
jgi:hypothetical protein